MLFTQLIILFTFISQIICVSISDLNNIALIQFTKRRGVVVGHSSGGGHSSVSQGGHSSVVEVQVVEVKVVDPAAALAVGLAVELKEEVQVVEVQGSSSGSRNWGSNQYHCTGNSCGYGNYFAPSAAAAAVGYGTGRYTGGTKYGNNQYHCSGSTWW